MKPAVAAMMMAIAGMMATLPAKDRPLKIPSHKIQASKDEEQLSKRKLQKIKGKKARKNRGNNRLIRRAV